MKIVWSALLVLLVASGAAQAEDRAKAREAFAAGRQHFDLGEYREALDSFKLAYRNFEDPTILFNIAQCHRQLGNKEEAVSFYRKYLNKMPNAPNRVEVQSTIDKLNAAMTAERASKAVPPQGTIGEPPSGGAPSATNEPPPPATVTPTPAPPLAVQPEATATREKQPLVKKWWLWTAVGGAVVAIGLGVGLGVGLSHTSRPGTDFPGVTF